MAARCVAAGGVIAYPTEAVWGLGCDPWNEAAVDKILRETLKPNQAGLIAVDRQGTIVMDYNTRGMACAAADSSGRFDVRWPRGLPKK